MKMQTFEEFAAEWFRQVTENGDSVSQEAIDMAQQAWEIATNAEREACAKLAEDRHDAWERGDGLNDADGLPLPVCDVTCCENIAAAIRARQ